MHLNNSKVNYVSSLRKTMKTKREKVLTSKKSKISKEVDSVIIVTRRAITSKDCRLLKKVNASKKRSSSANKANMIEEEIKDLVAIVIGGIKILQIGMVTKLHMTSIAKSFNWWLDFCATIHVCNNRKQFKSYKYAIDREVLMGNHNLAKVFGQEMVELNFTPERKLT